MAREAVVEIASVISLSLTYDIVITASAAIHMKSKVCMVHGAILCSQLNGCTLIQKGPRAQEWLTAVATLPKTSILASALVVWQVDLDVLLPSLAIHLLSQHELECLPLLPTLVQAFCLDLCHSAQQ